MSLSEIETLTDEAFAEQIRLRYPEGLTGIFAIGGTRTTYILEQNRQTDNPGEIKDFADYGAELIRRYWQLMDDFYALGGENAIVTLFSFRGFHNRGFEYAELMCREMLRLIDAESQEYYRSQAVDPYFVGVEPLKLLAPEYGSQEVARQFEEFQQNWQYQDGRRKVIWEVASIPLYSFWQASQQATPAEQQQLEAEVQAQTSLEDVYRVLYRYFARRAYGTDVPMPHFYLGSNKGGDLKWRSPMPLALSGGDYLRAFFTPYPSLFIKRATVRAILTDLAFRDRFHSAKTDYAGQYTSELVQAEYERVIGLAASPESVVGFVRKVT